MTIEHIIGIFSRSTEALWSRSPTTRLVKSQPVSWSG